jgi:hypothetical protein
MVLGRWSCDQAMIVPRRSRALLHFADRTSESAPRFRDDASNLDRRWHADGVGEFKTRRMVWSHHMVARGEAVAAGHRHAGLQRPERPGFPILHHSSCARVLCNTYNIPQSDLCCKDRPCYCNRNTTSGLKFWRLSASPMTALRSRCAI